MCYYTCCLLQREIVEFHWHQTWRLLSCFSSPLFTLLQAEAGGLYENEHTRVYHSRMECYDEVW